MKYNREQIINLRRMMIKHNVNESSIKTITEALINNPLMTSVVTDLDEIKNKYIKREYVSTGHGAFGEPEGYTDFYVCGFPIENRHNMVFLNENEEPIYANNSLNIEKLIEETKQKHNDSFTL
jgi:hypothetical protein